MVVDRRVTTGQLVGAVLAIPIAIAAVFVGKPLYDRFTDGYVVARADDGRAVTQVIRATFSRASALKVGALSGSVQATASDSRLGGVLTADRVIKAPFSVDYFIDVSRLRPSDYRYDATSRTLVIDAPDVTIGAANVDEARRTLSETRGLFVTRAAFDQMSRRVSAAAQASAATEAQKPERLAQARDNARRALAGLLAPPLAVAGAGDIRVVVTFPYERSDTRERWDQSLSIDQVIANRY